MEKLTIEFSSEPVIEPKRGCDWADTMVLNPALFLDDDGRTIHMLFRATGPWPKKNLKGISDPYPIFLGYAKSDDLGESFQADFSRPALAPALEYDKDKMFIVNTVGEKVMNFANGCVEDPRIFDVEGKTYLTVASRLFPPGPYWERDARRDNLPDWIFDDDSAVGQCARRNDTVTVMYELNKDALITGNYENAFAYVCPLTDGALTDNRDVFFFPKRFKIQGKEQLLMLHRPDNPSKFEGVCDVTTPSIMLAAAENFTDFATSKATNKLLATSEFDWEEERIGASFPPMDLGDGKWLVSYHGKQLPDYGYTQSFMILKEQENDFPKIIHRVSERLIFAKQKWELPDKFPCPCIFTTGAVVVDDTLLDYVCSMRVKNKTMPKDAEVVKTIVTTDLGQQIAENYGVKTVNVLTGFKFIGEEIGRLEKQGKADSYIFGFEESYGYLSGSYVRDKDAVDGAFLICEMLAYYKTRGISLLDKLDELYKKYGYCLNTLHSYEFEGSAGLEKMQNIMASMRNAMPEIGGVKVVKVNDYLKGIDGLPKSDVIKFYLEGNGSVVVRPSGTEPKMKVYVSISAADEAAAKAKESDIVSFMEQMLK